MHDRDRRIIAPRARWGYPSVPRIADRDLTDRDRQLRRRARWRHPVVPRVMNAMIVKVSPAAAAPPAGAPEPTHFINSSTGDDNRTYLQAQSPATPWATPGRAAWGSTNRSSPVPSQALQPGDCVQIAAGTYSFSGVVDDRFNPTYNPANSGTSNAPITFLAPGPVTLTAPNTLSPLIGAQNKDYIWWWGPFTLDEATIDTKPDTGPVTFVGATGCLLNGLTIIGIPDAVVGDNHNGVRFEGAVSCTVKNCTLHDWWDGTGQNGTLFTLYGSSNCIIEHNRGYNAGCAVYFKDTAIQPLQSGNRVRFNHFSDTTNSFFRWSHVAGGPVDRSFVYRNLCVNGFHGINFVDAVNDWVYANTFVNMAGAGISVGPTVGIRVWSCLFDDCDVMVTVEGSAMPADTVHDNEHNLYHTYLTFYTGTDGNRTFANYKATFTDQDQADPDSVDADPLFVNAGAGDYRLQGGSPARGIGVNPETSGTIDAGCYQDDGIPIGIES